MKKKCQEISWGKGENYKKEKGQTGRGMSEDEVGADVGVYFSCRERVMGGVGWTWNDNTEGAGEVQCDKSSIYSR